MLPFGRMFGYGNIIPTERNIKKVQYGQTHYVILDTLGDLWGSGTNTYYQLGISDKVTEYNGTSIKIQSNVTDVWASNNSTLIKKNDGSFWYCGLGGINNTQMPWTKLSAEFGSVLPSDIKNVFAHFQMYHFGTTDGSLYAIGANGNVNSGVAGGAGLSVLTLVPGVQNVKEIVYTTAAGTVLALTDSNAMYVWGRNANGELGLGNANAVPTPILSKTDVQMIGAGYSTTMCCQSNIIRTAGNQRGGQLGDGVINPSHVNKMSYNSVSYSGSTSKFITLQRGQGTFNMAFISSSGMYSTGMNTFQFGSGTTSDVGVFTKAPLDIDFNSVIGSSSTLDASCIYTKDALYQSGNGKFILGDGSSTNTLLYKKVQLPWENGG